jgi:pyrimidine operon attenuation protein/uracil phosphoribosyltransferase
MAREVAAAHNDPGRLALLGILTRGFPLAKRLAGYLEELAGARPDVGALSTKMYRDDLRTGRISGFTGDAGTHFDFDVDGRTVILVDDVLGTGRTVRAAMDEVMDYGRPQRIQLACLVDRGLRELPIQPDFLGWRLATAPGDHVRVRVEELDGEDAVLHEGGPLEGPAERP